MRSALETKVYRMIAVLQGILLELEEESPYSNRVSEAISTDIDSVNLNDYSRLLESLVLESQEHIDLNGDAYQQVFELVQEQGY